MLKLIALVFGVVALTSFAQSEKLTVGIVHYNDIYGQIFPFRKDSNPPITCTDEDTNCVGGVMQIGGHIKTIRQGFMTENFDSEFVIATGNLISGINGWLPFLNEDLSSYSKNLYTWKNYGKLIRNRVFSFGYDNFYMPNFTALGAREFDGGLTTLNTYLAGGSASVEDTTRPIVSNINCQSVQTFGETKFCGFVDSFKILNVGASNYKIGLIGFLDPKVVHFSEPGKLDIQDAVTSLKNIVDGDMKSVDTVIAFGSGTLELAITIAEAIPKVKLVVYGDENEVAPQEEYPFQHNGKYFVTAGKYGSTIGKLVLELDTATNGISVKTTDSKLITVDNSVEEDDYLKDEIDASYGGYLYKLKDVTPIATAKVSIDGKKENCWKAECTLGSLVADAMVHCAYQDKTLNLPADVIALWHAGGLADDSLLHGGDITVLEAYKWLPYSNNATLVTVNGINLKKILGISASALDDSPDMQWGQFLQVSSGLEVHYTKVDGKGTLTSFKAVKLADNEKLTMMEMNDASIYNIVIPSALYNGRNAYWELPGTFISGGGYDDHSFVGPAHSCLANYIKGMGAVKLGYNKRIYID